MVRFTICLLLAAILAAGAPAPAAAGPAADLPPADFMSAQTRPPTFLEMLPWSVLRLESLPGLQLTPSQAAGLRQVLGKAENLQLRTMEFGESVVSVLSPAQREACRAWMQQQMDTGAPGQDGSVRFVDAMARKMRAGAAAPAGRVVPIAPPAASAPNLHDFHDSPYTPLIEHTETLAAALGYLLDHKELRLTPAQRIKIAGLLEANRSLWTERDALTGAFFAALRPGQLRWLDEHREGSSVIGFISLKYTDLPPSLQAFQVAGALLARKSGQPLSSQGLEARDFLETVPWAPANYPPAPVPRQAEWVFAVLGVLALVGGVVVGVRPSRSGARGSTVGKGILTALGVALALGLVMELSVRILLAAAVPGGTVMRPHPSLFWLPRPNLSQRPGVGDEIISTNAQGLRSPQIPFRKPAGVTRVLLLGDSSFYGHNLAEDSTLRACLERRLSQGRPPGAVQVINGAVPGYTTSQGLLLLKEIGLRYHPDLVVVGFNNDPSLDWMADRDRMEPEGAALELRRVLFQSELYLWLRKEILAQKTLRSPLFSHSLPLTPRVSREDYQANLRALIETSRKAGARVILVDMPANIPPGGYPPNQAYRQILRRVAGELGVPVADALAVFGGGGRRGLFLDNMHPSAAGQELLARVIAQYLSGEGVGGGGRETPPHP